MDPPDSIQVETPPRSSSQLEQAPQRRRRGAHSVELILIATISFVILSLFNSEFIVRSYSVQNVPREFDSPNPAAWEEGTTATDSREREQSRESVLENHPRGSIHRIAFITFSYVRHNDTNKLFNFLLPAVDTWAAPLHDAHNTTFNNPNEREEFPLYVVFSNTSRKAFEDICTHDKIQIPPQSRKLCRRIHPIYVDCPEGRWGESPCCKQQKGLVEIFGKNYPLYDWYAFFDDDVYLRKEYVATLLAELQPPDFPMAASPYNQQAKPIGHGRKTCGVGMKQFLYPWGQPIFYSRGAMKMMEKGYRANSLVSQCAAFDLTHDVGNQVLNWMYSLPMATLPPLLSLPLMRGDYIGNHWVGREEMRSKTRGERDKSVGSWSFYGTHKKWMDPKLKHPRVEQLVTVRKVDGYKWYPNVTGFHQTLTYELHGDPQTWEEGQWFTMQYSDCMVHVV